ncbi:Mycolic acid cyclopropane synthetase-domain-containing protein [Dichotomopilus funicola]|uniref:Mycolic acid cyclopropane synthetase-domain-containing protein n=1 Tax=Dichotomopilus funicola TaxID=1934379 RepID=A0AAN6ZK60_9PEZI|nr:Mycolic acid cyclopropane synthetase-domain-containing protein [Dichotomopilus funicola]
MPPPAPRSSRLGFLRLIAHGASLLRDGFNSVLTLNPVAAAIARPAVLALLSSSEVGTLVLVDEVYGERLVLGQPLVETHTDESTETTTTKTATRHGQSPPIATLTITSPSFYPRLLLLADMGFAEAYLLSEVRCADLTAFFRLFILNRDRLHNGSTMWSSLLSGTLGAISKPLLWLGVGGRSNTVETALLNAQAHYDLSNDLFAAFLSPDMTYSCPIWTTTADETIPDVESLESAQLRKIHTIIAAARIKSTDHVLEIGTGWGSFAIEAVRLTGCRVTSVTLSREQKALAEEKIREEGMEGRIRVLLVDYRAVRGPRYYYEGDEGTYDKIVSIEMLEAVGKDFLGVYFAQVDKLLKKDGGIAVFQCITLPEGRQAAYSAGEDFINRYIFPGGYLPSTTQLIDHITAASHGTLIVESVNNIGGHYARTLRLWREEFLANFNAVVRPALKREHPLMSDEEIEVFRRKWEYYFSYCEAGFATKTLGDVIITVGREGAMELMEGIPL